MRLIDADALPKYTGYALSANEVAMAVENAPTVDAVPVVHGQWVQTNTYHLRHGDGLVSEAYCSVCEMYSYQLSAFPYVGYNYCPRCGAKMDGGANNG